MFSTTTVRVPYASMMMHSNDDKCIQNPGLTPRNWHKPYFQGSAFPRGVYAVFNDENKSIWIAVPDDLGSYIIPMGRGMNAVSVLRGVYMERDLRGPQREQCMGYRPFKLQSKKIWALNTAIASRFI